MGFTAVARLLMTLIVFYHSFPPRWQGQHSAPKPRGATQELIDSMPPMPFSPELQDEGVETSCAVCLSDFEWDEMVRRLPCPVVPPGHRDTAAACKEQVGAAKEGDVRPCP